MLSNVRTRTSVFHTLRYKLWSIQILTLQQMLGLRLTLTQVLDRVLFIK